MTADADFELVDSPEGFRFAAAALAQGRGPFAIDTERASAFRYDDRAFLVQINRQDAGTFLIAPEGHREAVADILGPVLNGEDWILHAASEDLASLALLNLRPGYLFDTELAARFAGFTRPNLGAMVEHVTGVELEKGHGREDWSTTPLPADWLEYAALDVVYLADLADALAQQLDADGMLGFAEQEFAHLIATRSVTPEPKTWRDLKGLSSVRSQAGLQVAKRLWEIRDAEALEADASPGTILPNRAIVGIAKALPSTLAELDAVREFHPRGRKEAHRWFGHVQDALDAERSTWPGMQGRPANTPPTRGNWERHHPESWESLLAARKLVAETARELGISPELLLSPAVLRQVVWEAARDTPRSSTTGPVASRGTGFAYQRLVGAGARPWQAEIVAPLLAQAQREMAAK